MNVSSQAGKRGFPMLGAYCAAKAGVILLTQVLAQELGRFGHHRQRRVPGHGRHQPHQRRPGLRDPDRPGRERGPRPAWLRREIPLNRLQQPEEVAAAIAFLCSDDADYITGEAVNVSGGQTMV